jgi:LysR family transcriptional regulator, transcription activator of glutamate synthase operon
VAELRQYRYFVEIARRGSFTAASKTLLVTQSALSEQVLQLERELDCRLFDRGRHGARLTDAGEALLIHAEQLLRLSSDIERSVSRWGKPRKRQIRLAMTVPPAFPWLPEVLADLEREHEDVEVVLADVSTAEIFLEVGTGGVDLGIVSVSDPAFELKSPAGISATKLLEENLVLLVPAAHELASNDSVPLDSLRNERMIAFLRGSTMRRLIDDLLEGENVRVRNTLESGRLDVAIGMVSAGLGVCVVPRSATVLGDGLQVKVLELEAADPPKRVLLALSREDSLNAALVSALVALIQERIASMLPR